MGVNGGFALDGQTARSLKMRMLRASKRPILPPTVDRTMAIPGLNGAWDFGADVGPKGFGLECAMLTRSPLDLQHAAEKLAALLLDEYGKPRTMRLVFDTRPERYYFARYSGSLDIDRIVGLGQFTLPLVAYDPHAYADLKAYDINYVYDTGLDYNTGLIYSNTKAFNWQTINTFSSVYNHSNLVMPFDLRITGRVANPKISLYGTGRTIGFSVAMQAGDVLEVTGSTIKAKINGANALPIMSGAFFPLLPGDNRFVFESASPDTNARIEFLSSHRFL